MFNVVEQDGPVAEIAIETPIGRITAIGELALTGTILEIRGLHVQGLQPGALGHGGIYALLCAALQEFEDVDSIAIFGARRTTGRRVGAVLRQVKITRGHCHRLRLENRL
jgi:hypothetical protein